MLQKIFGTVSTRKRVAAIDIKRKVTKAVASYEPNGIEQHQKPLIIDKLSEKGKAVARQFR